MKQASEDTDDFVASWGRIIILYKKQRAVSWMSGISSYLFLMCLSFTINIIAYYHLISKFWIGIMKQATEDTDESVSSWECIIILYQKHRADSWSRGIYSYNFLMCLSFTTNIIAYYILIWDTPRWSGPRKTVPSKNRFFNYFFSWMDQTTSVHVTF